MFVFNQKTQKLDNINLGDIVRKVDKDFLTAEFFHTQKLRKQLRKRIQGKQKFARPERFQKQGN